MWRGKALEEQKRVADLGLTLSRICHQWVACQTSLCRSLARFAAHTLCVCVSLCGRAPITPNALLTRSNEITRGVKVRSAASPVESGVYAICQAACAQSTKSFFLHSTLGSKQRLAIVECSRSARWCIERINTRLTSAPDRTLIPAIHHRRFYATQPLTSTPVFAEQ